MQAKFVFEKFTDESDPIHDLNIGYNIDFKKIKHKFFSEYRGRYSRNKGLKDWLNYIHTLDGKIISGYFQNEEYIESESNSKYFATFKIFSMMSFKSGKILRLYDENNKTHIVIFTEKYHLS
jgi:hypothetical protein